MTHPTPPRPLRPRASLRRGALVLTSSLSLLGALALGSTQAQATPTDSGAQSRESAFAKAAQDFGVPQAVLEATSYSLTRWEAHAGEHNTDGGYGPMDLVDGTLFAADQAEGKNGTDGSTPGRVPAQVDTLGQAATLLGVSRDTLRKDDAANIRGGAALMAKKQKALGLPVGATTDPGQWYATVAAASHSSQAEDAQAFADDAYAVMGTGATRTTADGKAMALAAKPATPQKAQLAKLGLASAKPNPNVECPKGLGCEWLPAPYEQYGPDPGDYGNHDLANRDTQGPKITQIVIHDTECTWDVCLGLAQDPTYLAWHYTIRSSDGQIAQHVPTKDVGWHAGNWYVNMHSIGIEHEGFAAAGATWYTEALYRKSAKLVGYLATKYGIPLDRAHIIGHDQVPGITPANVAGMHWDPGPYWDWSHYFDLLGAPLTKVTGKPSAEIVRITPNFKKNMEPVTGCDTSGSGTPCEAQGTNFVYLHQSPSDDSPLVNDIGLKPDGSPATTDVADIGARATAGVEYAVAGRQGDWTAIWYLGSIAWFENPVKHPTATNVSGSFVVPKAGKASVPVYGRAYPEASAYPSYIPVQTVTPLQYTIKAGQRVVLSDARVPTDYYRATTFDGAPPTDHVDVVGQDTYYQVSFGHRTAYVRADDVDIVKAK